MIHKDFSYLICETFPCVKQVTHMEKLYMILYEIGIYDICDIYGVSYIIIYGYIWENIYEHILLLTH